MQLNMSALHGQLCQTSKSTFQIFFSEWRKIVLISSQITKCINYFSLPLTIGLELLCYNEPVTIQRAYAYTAFISEDQISEHNQLIDCKKIFNGRNITTDFEDMWCSNFETGEKFCHIVMELLEPTEITSKLFMYLRTLEIIIDFMKKKTTFAATPMNPTPNILCQLFLWFPPKKYLTA